MFDPDITRDGELVPQFEWGRGAPSSIVVNAKGKRFANEALPYHEFARRIAERGAAPGAPAEHRRAWLIFDQAVQRRLRVLSVLPGDEPPDWFATATTAAELAQRIGVPPSALARSLDRFNEHAMRGDDPDFTSRRQAYRAQLSLYGTAWKELTGEPVKQRLLWYVRSGVIEEV